MRRHGFTLIELLIVVAIIAILAAIAVPNFLEAQTRAKVSRAKADIRSLATAIEAYRIDHNSYPNDIGNDWPWYPPDSLSTPVAYITNSFLPDPFRISPMSANVIQGRRFRYVNYIAGRDGWSHYGTPNDGGAYGMGLHSMTSAWTTGLATFGEWKLSSAGPDQNANLNFVTEELIYDATNGTISQGDIVRSQLEPEARP
ncbi:MAG: prepilin-type N-terminal cleavage/methylation domain-containing protein [Candidatus Sumerlaeia bacterium]|nr:prepilin-type N-terminal cleavage/methylation domain-containing protein [Candidatus Sumerlaeia bacterium]